MLVRPPVKYNNFAYKDSTAGATHTTGPYISMGATNTGWASFQHGRTSMHHGIIDLTTYTGSNNYTGWVRIVARGIRISNGSTIEFGEAWYYVTPTSNDLRTQVTPSYTSGLWNTWNNGGWSSHVGTGFSKYLVGTLQHNGNFYFAYESFAIKEKDPLNGLQFINANSLKYEIDIYWNTRRESEVTEVTRFHAGRTRTYVIPNSLHAAFSEYGDSRGVARTTSRTQQFFSPPGGIVASVYIDTTNNYMMYGVYANESPGNPMFITRFNEIVKSNTDLTKRVVNDVSWIEKTLQRTGVLSSITNIQMSLFAVDQNDPNNGGRATFYHNSAYDGTSWGGRRMGWSSVGAYISSASTNITNGNGEEDAYNTLTGFPEFNATGEIIGNWITSAPTMPREVHAPVRVNGRPMVLYGASDSYDINFPINSGTYAAPDFSNRLTISTGTDTSNFKRIANSTTTNIPAFFRTAGINCTDAKSDGTSWIYVSGTTATDVYIGRIRFSGTAGTEFDWNNWTAELLFSYPRPTEGFNTAPITDTMTNSNILSGFLLTILDTGNIVNGFPTIYFTHMGFITRLQHNGGTSTTTSDNWTYTKLIGRPTIPSEFTEGTGVGVTGGSLGSRYTDNFNYAIRKQKIGDWIYGTVRTSILASRTVWAANVVTGELKSLSIGLGGESSQYVI